MAWTPLAYTPLYHWHALHGAQLVQRHGWQVAATYSDIEGEISHGRLGLCIVDISSFAKLSLFGQGLSGLVETFMGNLGLAKSRSVARLAGNTPGLACRLTRERLLLLSWTMRTGGATDLLANWRNLEPLVTDDVTSSYAGICLLGVSADRLLRRLTSLDLAAALPPASCAETSVAGVQALLIRPPLADVPVLCLYMAWDLAEYAWETLLEAGRREGVRALGLDAWQHLILEGNC
jgi:glycine cleavage system aminomethyltransferase T